ncbi:hypothetical protein [Nonomuraea sp. NPDC049646]|uniref:hypothetical protein n=1 Tax=unclassified Nonomuraea TaxID=2593643 RepID=UPI0037AD0F27
MPAPDLFTLSLPGDGEQPTQQQGEVVPFPHSHDLEPAADTPAVSRSVALRDRIQPLLERTETGWRTAWVGDGILGRSPRPVADLARQFWTDPKPYIKDALILRIPYAVYGTPVIIASAAAHLFLLVISYPSLLAGTSLLVLFISLFL